MSTNTETFSPSLSEIATLIRLSATYWEYNSEATAKVVAGAAWMLVSVGKTIDAETAPTKYGRTYPVIDSIAITLWGGKDDNTSPEPLTEFFDSLHEVIYHTVVGIIEVLDRGEVEVSHEPVSRPMTVQALAIEVENVLSEVALGFHEGEGIAQTISERAQYSCDADLEQLAEMANTTMAEMNEFLVRSENLVLSTDPEAMPEERFVPARYADELVARFTGATVG